MKFRLVAAHSFVRGRDFGTGKQTVARLEVEPNLAHWRGLLKKPLTSSKQNQSEATKRASPSFSSSVKQNKTKQSGL